MSTKIVVAVAFIVLFSLGLGFQGAPNSTILLCALSIILGSMLPDLDRMFYAFWPQLRILVMLMAGVLFAYSFSLGPSFCYFFHIPACTVVLPVVSAFLIAILFIFDFLNPSKPPFHSLIAMAFSAIIYSIVLSHLGYIETSFLATGAFAAAFILHYFLEAINVDRSQMV